MAKKLVKGKKVRCIEDRFRNSSSNPFEISEITLPVKGRIYTIRNVINTEYGWGVRLREIKNPRFYFEDTQSNREPAFRVNRFQPA